MDHITNPMQRQQYLRNLEQQTIYNAVSQGRMNEALSLIADLHPGPMRYELLSQVANQIGPGLKRAAAMNLLETARSLIGASSKAENQEQMAALLAIGTAFAKYQ